MTRLALIAIAAAACSSSQASKLDDKPANLVCERIKIADPKATCTPELTASGETHVHRARVTQEKNQVVCVLNDLSVSVVCGPMFVQPEQPKPAPVAEAPKPEAPKATKR